MTTPLRPIGPDELSEPEEHDTRPAYERARELLYRAEDHANGGDLQQAALLAVLGQAWATLALTEPSEPDLSVPLAEPDPLEPDEECCTPQRPHPAGQEPGTMGPHWQLER